MQVDVKGLVDMANRISRRMEEISRTWKEDWSRSKGKRGSKMPLRRRTVKRVMVGAKASDDRTGARRSRLVQKKSERGKEN